MNKIYKVIYSKVRQCYVVVSEIAKSHGRHTHSSVAKSSSALTAAVLIALGTFTFMGTPAAQAEESVKNNDFVAANSTYWYWDTKTNTWKTYDYHLTDVNNNRSWKDLPNYKGGGAKLPGAITAGQYAQAGQQTITIGDRNAGQSRGSVFIGEHSGYTNVGDNVPAGIRDNYVTAVGFQSGATGWGSIAIGSNAIAENTKKTDTTVTEVGEKGNLDTVKDDVYGIESNPTIEGASVALGYSAKAKDGNIAIGAYSDATDTTTSTTPYVSVGNSTLQRRITNVANGTAATDVATVGQLQALEKKTVAYNEGWGIKIGDYTKKDAAGNETTVKNAISVDRNLGSNEITTKSKNTFKAAGENSLILGGAGTDDLVYINGIPRETQFGAYGKDSVLVGGENNKITDAGTYAVISGGGQNIASGEHSFIGGGWWNTASGATSAVLGGQSNTASGNQSTIVGGDENRAIGDESTILGGYQHTAIGDHSTISGGDGAYTFGTYSSVSGGQGNAAIGTASSADGGWLNYSYGDYSQANGGYSNYTLGNTSSSLGGRNGVVQGNVSVGIAGGSTEAGAGYALAAGYQSVVTAAGVHREKSNDPVDSYLEAGNNTGGNEGYKYTDVATALGYQATADAPNTVSFGHDEGDVSGYTVVPDYEFELDSQGNIKFDADGKPLVKSVKLTNITTNYYDSAKYNRLVKAADGIEDHDAVVMEQLKNASGVGSKIKVYQTDEKGNIKFDKNNNPIEDTSDSDAVKTKREVAQKASEDAWGKAIGTGSITDPTESETNDPEKNGSQQLVTGGTVYKALHGGLDDIVIGHDGKDGQPGKDGSIGLVGPKGKDGKDGFTTTVIKTEKGVDGVDGKNGEDGITRIVYNDTTDPDKKHTVATLDDGMKYAGDTGDAANVKLDHQLKLSGTTFNKTDKQYKEEDWTSDNIAVVSNAVDKDGNAVMNLKLAKDIKGLNSSTFTTTETTGEGNQQKTTTYETLINDKGLTITSKSTENGTTTPTNGPSITIDGINAGNKAITNIGSVVKDGKYTDGQKNYAATLGDVSAIARNTVKVVPGTHTSVTKGTDADNATTYAVNVITGTVNQNDQGLVTGDEVFKAIENLKISGGSDIKVDLNKLATTDAKNVGKNYSSCKTTDEEKTADVNYNENAWGEALGTGEVADPNADADTNRSKQLVTGGTVYTAIHDTLNGGLEKIIVGHDGTNGQDGKEGSIGLNGNNGKDGKDGITTTVIKTEKGQIGEKGETGAPGVDGTDITRIVYENKKNDDGKHTVATLDDGMKYAGDVSETGATDAVANVKLDHQLKLSGTTFNDTKKYNAADWTSDNIAVVSSAVDTDGNAVLNLKLAKDLKDLHSGEYTTTAGDKTYTTIKCARGGASIWSNVNLRKLGKRGASTPASGRDG